MSRRIVFLVLVCCLVMGQGASASAATTWVRLGGSPFHQPSLRSEADLQALVRSRGVDLEAGFAKAGYPALYPAFMQQFPAARIDSVKVAPGERFTWVLFKSKATGRVAVLKDVTWKGAESFDAYRFTIDQDGKRHEFLVPYVCGNVALRGVGPIPPAPVAVAAPAPVVKAAPAAIVPAAAPVPPPPAPIVIATPAPAAKAAAAVPPPPPPVVRAPVAVAPVAPAAVAAKAVAVMPPPPPPPVMVPAAGPVGGPLFDVGLSRQIDPANYVFARVGYEVPLADRLYLMGLIGGYLRWMGNDGGNAFTADVLLDYHWAGRLSVGGGAGYWSGNGGQLDLIANLGFLVAGDPDAGNTSLFLEARLPVDELDNTYEYGRFGLGLRFRF